MIIISWLAAHPVAASYIVLIGWPVVTGGVNFAFKEADAYALTHPRFAAFKKLLQKWGLSPKGTIALLRRLFTKATNLPPPDDSGSFGALSSGIVPPPPPTKPDVTMRLRARLGIGFAVVLATTLMACSSAQTHSSIELGAYTADDGVCVTEAASKDAGSECLDKYKRLYSVFWADSGTTVCSVAVKDGGQ